MSTIYHQAREISVKIVYYGPGLGGKTSSLQAIHKQLTPQRRGQLVSLATGMDRTLYFDFLPVRARVQDFSVRLQLYTVPGQVHYNSTRKLVLGGADAVVFVADSQATRLGANDESFANLKENLREQGCSLAELPLVFQYNKRDAPDIVPVSELNSRLNDRGAPFFETVAVRGKGVFDALKTISRLALGQLTRQGAVRAKAPVQTPPLGMPVVPEAGETPATRPSPNASSPLLSSLENLRDRVEELAPEPPHSESGEHEVARADNRHSLGELVQATSTRSAIAVVENDIDISDWAAAVRHAGRGYKRLAADAAGHDAGSSTEAAAMAALAFGLPASWLHRFREALHRVITSGAVTSDDALFALLFLSTAALRADETRGGGAS